MAHRREIIVGIIVILSLAIITFIAQFTHLGSSNYSLKALFSNIDGLDIDSEVRISGIKIGRVSGVRLTPTRSAEVTMDITDMSLRLPLDSSASIRSDSLFGNKFVSLVAGGDEFYFTDGDFITYTEGSMILSELLNIIISRGEKRIEEKSYD